MADTKTTNLSRLVLKQAGRAKEKVNRYFFIKPILISWQATKSQKINFHTIQYNCHQQRCIL